MIVSIIFLNVALIAAIVLISGCTNSASPSGITPTPQIVYVTVIVSPIPTPAPLSTVKENTDKATLGEINAALKAKSYLRTMPFSRTGLIEQLEYEGFTHQEAVYGVAQSGADWNEQAALKAKSYLRTMPFSRTGLIEQLEYEGFTRQEAEYGVRAVGY